MLQYILFGSFRKEISEQTIKGPNVLQSRLSRMEQNVDNLNFSLYADEKSTDLFSTREEHLFNWDLSFWKKQIVFLKKVSCEK